MCELSSSLVNKPCQLRVCTNTKYINKFCAVREANKLTLGYIDPLSLSLSIYIYILYILYMGKKMS